MVESRRRRGHFRVEDVPSSLERRLRTEVVACEPRPLLRIGRASHATRSRKDSPWLVSAMLTPPPLLLDFQDLAQFERMVGEALPASELRTLKGLFKRGLPPVSSAASLALLFGYSTRFVWAISKRPSRHYRSFDIRSGTKSRRIRAPRIALKLIQSWFGHHVSRSISVARHVHGFVPGRSTLSAASVHCPAQWIIAVDIRKFFESITRPQVYNAVCQLGYTHSASWLIADLMTLDGVLPQGSPASPVLSNLVFAETDKAIAGLARRRRVRITRYADDITLSGSGKPPAKLHDDLCEILRAKGWRVATEKTVRTSRTAELTVLGLRVHGARPRLSKQYRNRVRMMLHIMKRTSLDPIADAETIRSFAGHIAYATGVSSYALASERDAPGPC